MLAVADTKRKNTVKQIDDLEVRLLETYKMSDTNLHLLVIVFPENEICYDNKNGHEQRFLFVFVWLNLFNCFSGTRESNNERKRNNHVYGNPYGHGKHSLLFPKNPELFREKPPKALRKRVKKGPRENERSLVIPLYSGITKDLPFSWGPS